MRDPPSVPRLIPQTADRNGAMTSRPRQNNGERIPNHGGLIGLDRRTAPTQGHLSAQARNVLGWARNDGVTDKARMFAEVHHTARIHPRPKATRLRATTAPHAALAPPSAAILMPPAPAKNHRATTRGSGTTGKLAKLRARHSALDPMLAPKQGHLIRPSATGQTTGMHVISEAILNGAVTRCAGLIARPPI